MADVETLAERVRTVERAVTDGECEFPDVTRLADIETRVETLEDRIDDLDDRATELDAATQALRGYVGNVRSVNEDVEQRADAALAATERLEARVDELPEVDETASESMATASQQGAAHLESGRGPSPDCSRAESTAGPTQNGSTDHNDGLTDWQATELRETIDGPCRPDRVTEAESENEPVDSGLLARIRAHL